MSVSDSFSSSSYRANPSPRKWGKKRAAITPPREGALAPVAIQNKEFVYKLQLKALLLAWIPTSAWGLLGMTVFGLAASQVMTIRSLTKNLIIRGDVSARHDAPREAIEALLLP
jgi:hypothetical protein